MKSFCVAYSAGLMAVFCIVLSVSAALPVHNKNRTTRGFKNAALSTARGFGKRAGVQEHVSDDETRRELFGRILRERSDADSFPVDWFAEELAGNPELARIVSSRLSEELQNNIELSRLLASKIIDLNQDGELSADELLRTSY